MAPTIVVLIRQDPRASAKPVEALRIALGLGAGENPVTVVLLDGAPRLLSEEQDELLDGDILEKYLPSLKQGNIPFVLAQDETFPWALDPDFAIRKASRSEIRALVSTADHVLAF